MRRSSVVALGGTFIAVVVIAGFSRIVAADGDMNLGTWKLNLAKSTYDPGPAPKGATRTYQVFEGDGVAFTQETVNADGTHTTISFRAHYDGKEYKWTGNVNADTIALKRIDAYTHDVTQKKAGTLVQTTRVVVSKDGKVLTNTQKSPPDATRRVNNVVVFDKQ
jgi:hypothetical protein